jgi:dephospho-CoA kinase
LPKLVVGLTGLPRSGKGEFVRFLTEWAGKYGLSVGAVRFSDALVALAKTFGIEVSRENLQGLASDLKKYAHAPIAYAAFNAALQLENDIVVVDGIRWPEDEEGLQKISNNVLVYVEAELETRWRRARSAAEKAGDADVTLERFREQDSAQTEIFISDIGSRAECALVNNGTLEEYRKKVGIACYRYIASKIPRFTG